MSGIAGTGTNARAARDVSFRVVALIFGDLSIRLMFGDQECKVMIGIVPVAV